MWAIVPVRSLTSAKSRLASALDLEARQQLQRTLLEQTLVATQACLSIERTLVVTADPQVKHLAEHAGATALLEPSEAGEGPEARLNGALDAAATVASQQGASSILVLPSDLPCLDGVTLDEVTAELPNDERAVAVLSDRHEDGTNALFCRPPQLLQFAFGRGSCEEHLRRGRAAGAVASTLQHPNIALDLDTPDDLAALRRRRAVPAALRTLLDAAAFAPAADSGAHETVRDSRSRQPAAPSAASPGD